MNQSHEQFIYLRFFAKKTSIFVLTSSGKSASILIKFSTSKRTMHIAYTCLGVCFAHVIYSIEPVNDISSLKKYVIVLTKID